MAARVTQLVRRVAIEPDDAKARVTQLSRRVVVEPTSAQARVTQLTRRVVLLPKSFYVEAWIWSPTRTGSFTASAIIGRTQASSFTVNAIILASSGTQTFTANALLLATAGSSFTASAIKHKTIQPTGFTADAWIQGPTLGSFTVDAAIALWTRTGSFTASAIIGRTQAGSFIASATIRRTQAGSFTTNAKIIPEIIPGFHDDFDRVESEWLGWGPLGQWVTEYDADKFSVDGDLALVDNRGSYLRSATISPLPGAIRSQTVWEIATRVRWPGLVTVPPGAGIAYMYYGVDVFNDPSWSDEVYVEFRYTDNGDSTTETELYLGGCAGVDCADWQEANSTSFPTPTPGDWYILKWQIDLANGTARAKVWNDSGTEPGWLLSISGLTLSGLPDTGSLTAYWVEVAGGGPNASFGTWATDYVYFKRTTLTLDAVLGLHVIDSFQVSALLARNAFTLDAQIKPGGAIRLDAIVRGAKTGAYTLDAFIFDGFTHAYGWHLDAMLRQVQHGGFSARAEIVRAHSTGGGSAYVDALILDTISASFTLDAVLDGGLRTSSFHVDADLLGLNEQRRTFALDASLRRQGGDLFILEALLEAVEVFRLDAWIAGRILLDAAIRAPVAGSTTLNAWLTGRILLDALINGTRPPRAFTLDATLADTNGAFPGRRGSFTLDSWVLAHMDGDPPIWLNAWIVWPDRASSFTLDAFVRPYFTLDAWISWPDGGLLGGIVTLDAYIRGNDTIIWPGEQAGSDGSTSPGSVFSSPSASFNAGMVGSTIIINGVAYIIVSVIDEHTITVSPTITPGQVGLPWTIQPDAVDSDGEPIPDWFKASRKYRVNITLDGLDVTGDVIWAQTSFTQNAKTNPGTFELTLRGVFGFDGGEVILVSLDDFRVFGGYVLSIEKGYRFAADAGDPITILHGADFNILFDKLIVYNKASADDPQGSYTNWRSFKKNTSDITIIHKVFSSYVDLPAGFNYTTFVDEVGNAAPEKPWVMPQAGSPLRQVMQSLSQTTNAVWWIDPYMYLHYGSRTTVTAPYPITDGLGGISSQNISMSEDMSMLVTETVMWGTLAYNVEGEIVAVRKVADSYPTYGPWQYGEFRIDLHHEAFLDRRTDSIIERYGQPIRRAKVVIFDPGYQAGQVADVRLTEHGLEAPLVIRSLALTFAVAKEPALGFYYCVPRYELSVGLDPEEPWDIYDYLPFPDDAGIDYPPRRRRTEEGTVFVEPHVTSELWGMGMAYSPYEFHALFEMHNMDPWDQFSVIAGRGIYQVPEYWWNYNPNSPDNGVWKSPVDDYTYDSFDNYFTPGPVDPTGLITPGLYLSAVAGFASRVCRGDMTNGVGGEIKVGGWEEDVGPWLPQPGHENHTGNSGNIVPCGDLDSRIVKRVERSSYVPLNASSTLISTGNSPDIRDIQVFVWNTWMWMNDYPFGVPVRVKVRRTQTSMVEGPPDIFGGPLLIDTFASAIGGWVNVGEVDGMGAWPDIVFELGDAGCAADPVDLSEIFCNLDYRQRGPAISENRWPSESFHPNPNYLFCPFHFGLNFLDGFKLGYIPVLNSMYTTIWGVEQTFPVAPGWGQVGTWSWIPGSAQLEDITSVDASHDYTQCSGVVLDPLTKQHYGFLRLPVPVTELETYDWAKSSVFVDWRDGADMGTKHENWCFDWVGKFVGGQGVGDQYYGPFFEAGMGGCLTEIQPSRNYLDYEPPGYAPPFYGMDIDFYKPFRVRWVSSAYGIAIKIWQLGDPMPDEWHEWDTWYTYRPTWTIGATPRFSIWQDRTRYGNYASPYMDVDFQFICLDYQLTEDTDPLIPGPTWDIPPTGANIPDMLIRTKDMGLGVRLDDPEGEVYGAIGDGWNSETLVVVDGQFETTARVTRGTLAVYNETGILQHPVDDWQYVGDDGMHFRLTNTAIGLVTVVYRAWIVNLRSEYSVTRQPDPSGARHRPIPETW